jgi:hypothetical protein
MGGLVCFIAGLGLLIGLLGGVAVVRAAVGVTNRLLGPPRAKAFDTDEEWEWEEWDEPEELHRKGEKAIPEPGFGRAVAIAFAGGVVNAVAAFILVVVGEAVDAGDLDDGPALVLLVLFAGPLGFAALTLFLTAALPTTFWRAALVAFVHYAIVLLIALVVGGGVFVVLNLAGP